MNTIIVILTTILLTTGIVLAVQDYIAIGISVNGYRSYTKGFPCVADYLIECDGDQLVNATPIGLPKMYPLDKDFRWCDK